MLDFVFTNAHCGNCHTCISIADLDYFELGSNETKSYLCYLSCFCRIVCSI